MKKVKLVQNIHLHYRIRVAKAASYTIYLDDVALEASETRMDDSKVKYQLTKNSNETVALLNTLSDKSI